MEPIAAVRAVHMAATVLLAGTFAFERFVVPGRAPAIVPAAVLQRMVGWLRSMRIAGVLLALVSWAAWLAAAAASMSGRPVGQALRPDVLGTVLADTTFGHVWLLRLVLLLLLGARLRFSAIGALLAAAALAGIAWTGHAVGTDPRHAIVDALHLLGAGLWLGTLLPLALVLGRAGFDADWRALAVACTRRYSAVGLVAVVVLAATGVLNAFWLMGDVSDFTDTAYGQLLSAKLGLVTLMVALALVNRLLIVPKLKAAHPDEERRAIRRLARNAWGELVAGASILAIVGALGIIAPPGHEHRAHQMEGMGTR